MGGSTGFASLAKQFPGLDCARTDSMGLAPFFIAAFALCCGIGGKERAGHGSVFLILYLVQDEASF